MTRVLRNRSTQRGSAMLVTLVVIAALLAGAGVLVSMQLSSNRSSDLTRSGLEAMYCAEAGLAAAQPIVASNYQNWSIGLGTNLEPTWLSTSLGTHDIDNPPDGIADYTVFLRDNDDELPPAVNDPLHDSDLRVFIVSTCTKYADTVQQVEELVQFTGGGTCYQSQQGGCGGNGNGNTQ